MLYPVSKLDIAQIIQAAFDETTQQLRTSATLAPTGALEIIIDQADDSIAIGDGTTLFTGTTIGPKHGLDVNVINPISITGAITITATDLDIRDLTFATDKVDASGSIVGVTGDVSVTATDLDIRNLVFADDKVDVSGSSVGITGTAAVTQSGTWDINDITGTISLPTGAATSDLQLTGNSILTSIDSKFNSLGQKLMSGSVPVVIASDQSIIAVSGTTSITGSVAVTQDTTPWEVSSKTDLTPSSPTAATVGITSALVVAANANRKGLVLINTSSSTISFGLGTTAVLYSGISLPSGFAWTMDEFTFTTAAINAIASGAASNLSIQEFT